MAKITDQFKVGDRVKWSTERRTTSSHPIVMTYEGVIKKVHPKTATVLVDKLKSLKRVSLSKLKVIE